VACLATCHCQDCDESFDLADVRSFIARWQVVVAWIDAAPMLPKEQ
jgi:hypothetical protein